MMVMLTPGAVPKFSTICTSPLCLGFITGLSAQPFAELSNMKRVQFLSWPQSALQTILRLCLHKAPLACKNRKYPLRPLVPLLCTSVPGSRKGTLLLSLVDEYFAIQTFESRKDRVVLFR